MLTPSRALARAAKATPLPRVPELEPLYQWGFIPRRGQLWMIGAPPGAGKSTFILWLVYKMGVSTLYLSPDMSPLSASRRLGALVTGESTDWVAAALDKGGRDFVADEMEGLRIQWCFDSGPTLQDVAEELDAYVELWDAYPEVLVVDVLMSMESGEEDEQSGLKYIVRELHRLAHGTNVHVILAHHTREEGNPSWPAPREKIQGKVNQLPELITTVALDGDIFRLAAVKNRDGRQDPTAQQVIELTADPEHATYNHHSPKISWSYA